VNIDEIKARAADRLTKPTIGCFRYDLKDHTSVPGEFGTYDAFFNYSMAVKRLGEYEDKMPELISEIDRLKASLSAAEARAEKAERRADRAIGDLNFACGPQPSASSNDSICDICKHKNEDGTCGRQCFMNSMGAINRWEWRGEVEA